MSVPQGSTPFNIAPFQSLTNRVNAALSCADLQALVTEGFESIQGTKSAIDAQIAALQPLLALLSPPATNPGAIVTWLTTFITHFLTPLTAPYTSMAAQLTALATEVASLTTAITTAQAKFSSCSISIPPIT